MRIFGLVDRSVLTARHGNGPRGETVLETVLETALETAPSLHR
jgi:hypothetical protein